MLRRAFLTAAPLQFAALLESSAENSQPMQFFGPVIDRVAGDAEFRQEFVDYARERLGMARFNQMLYELIQDAKPQVRHQPLVLRMMRRVIWGSGRRCRRRLLRR